ncbi:hypothetical protein D3C87_1777490 [compost metagenome]
MIHEFHGRGTRAAFRAIDHDEVRRNVGFKHGLDDGKPFPRVTHAELEAHRLAARQFPQARHEFQQPDGRVEGRVAGRGIAVLPRDDAARLRDFDRDFARGQDTAMPRLGALGQLDFNHLHLRCTGVLDEGFF